jgi:DNA primase
MNVWEEIKSKLDIVDVISEYISVKPSGANYKALSPFKKEKTPSLMISQTKQIWHDFSTGEGGDIFKWVMAMEQCTKAEALQKLAKKAGIKLESQRITNSKTTQAVDDKRVQGQQLIQWAAQIYHSILKKILSERNHPITQYCISRKLTNDVIDTFHLGYAPAKNALYTLLKNKHPELISLAIETGILTRNNDTGAIKDKFSDRLMIPIDTADGNIIGFTGRVLPHDTNENRPKYLNSPQSDWFDKSSLWFRLSKAKKAILQEKKVILVEGNMDVIALHGKGYNHALASQGTSFTTRQLEILKRFTKQVLIAFDNDTAGQQAGEKLFIQTSLMGFDVFQVLIPNQYKDIDEYLNSSSIHGPNHEFRLEYKPYMEAWISKYRAQLTSSDSAEQKKYIEQAIQLISVLDDISQEQYTQILSSITNIQANTIQKLIQKNQTKNSPIDTIKTEFVLPTNPASEIEKYWKNILAHNSSHPEILSSEIIQNIATLLHSMNIISSTSVAEYIQDNIDELELITEYNKEEKKETDHSIKTLITLLDTQVSGISSLGENAIQLYVSIKQSTLA